MKKRVFTAVCCMAITLSLISCKANQNQTPSDSSSLKTQIKVGSPIFAPYFYVGEDGGFTGIDKEIAEEAFDRMNVEVVFEDIVWGERDRLLKSKEIDCIWGCFVMDGREERYQWAGPYLTSELAAVVSADSEIQTVDDLTGKSAAVRVDSKAEEFFLGKLSDGSPMPETLNTFNSMREAFVWFGKGYADAVVDHKAALLELTKDQRNLYRFLDGDIATVNLGVAFRTDYNSTFVDDLTKVLDEMKEDGTISRITQTYQVGGNS